MKGAYVLVIELLEDDRVRVGALGTVAFPRGHYAYVGSAQGGIEQRVSRHKSKRKKKRWHIDYLLDRAEVVSTVLIPLGGKDMECRVAQALMGARGVRIVARGFGSSDCRCRSHLFYLGPTDEAQGPLEDALSKICTLESVYPRSADQ